MSEQTQSQPAPAAQSVVPQPVPPGTTQFVAPPPSRTPSNKPGCGYTLLIVIVTVFLTITVEIVGGFFLVSYLAKTAWKSIQKDLSPFSSLLKGSSTSTAATGANTSGSMVKLTADQKKLIQSFGIDPATIPSEIPVQQITCVENAIGNDRIQQILKGQATPGITDLFKARGCLTN